MAEVPVLASNGTFLFWASLFLMVTALQSLVPNGQKSPVSTSTPATDGVTSSGSSPAVHGYGESGAFDCSNKTSCDTYCGMCVKINRKPQQCYEVLVEYCLINFNNAMASINSTEWCSLERVKSAYNKFTICTETLADCVLLPWPNQFVERTFVDIHTTFFQDCTTEALRDPPPNIVLALVMTPICLIPVMVILVVLKTKNGDRSS